MSIAADQQPKAGFSVFSALRGATGPLIGLVLLCVFLAFATDKFMSVRNLLNILDQISVLGIMAVGMTLVILIGGIDLAVGSVLALAMMVMGYVANVHGYPMGVGIAVALVVAAIAGAVSGLLITVFRVPAFIATLAMMSAARGVANMITDGQQIVGFPSWFSLLAYTRFGGFLTLTVAIMIVVFILAGSICATPRVAGRSMPLAAIRKWRVWPASMSISSRPASMWFRAFWLVSPASFSPCVSTRCSPQPALVTSSTRLPPSSSVARA